MDRVGFDTAVCRVCEGPCPAGFALCFCCRTAVRQLQLPLAPVVAITTYRVGDRTHRLLRGYKDAPVGEVRRRCVGALSALVERWMADNAGRLRERFGHPWSVVATVPSSCRPTGSPADAVATRVPDLARLHCALLVRGAGEVDHLVASRHGFELAPGIDPGWLRAQRVLVFDDSITTGARAQRAVAALRGEGARVAGVLAVGRATAAHGPPAPLAPCSARRAAEPT